MPHLPRHEGYGALMKKIAKSTQLTTHDVKAVLRAAWAIAYAEANKNTEVRIPCFEPLKLKHKPTRKAGPKVMKHKPARKAGPMKHKPAQKADPNEMFMKALNNPVNTQQEGSLT